MVVLRSCLGVLGFATVLLTSSVGEAGPAFVDPEGALLCVNTLQPFGFGLSSASGGAAAAYDANPFRNGGADLEVMPDERLRYIRESGFNCIRMAVDIGVLIAARDDVTVHRLVGELIAGLDRRVTAGLKVIVDIHPLPKGTHPVNGFSDVDLVDGPKGPKFSRLVQVVSDLAIEIRKRFRPSQVALELFNEPPMASAFRGKELWNKQIEIYWQQIRRVLPEHTLIVAGMGFAEIDGTGSGVFFSGLTNLRPESYDTNTGFAFHPYESGLFTHQGSRGFYSYVHGLTFPAEKYPGGQAKAEMDFIAALEADRALSSEERKTLIKNFIRTKRHSYSFARYWSEFGSPEGLSRRLAVVTAWADRHRLDRRQIFNTEFGVNRDQEGCTRLAPEASAQAFIRATVENSRRAGIGVITIHELQGSCFAVSSSVPPFDFDPGILAALGLNQSKRLNWR